MASSGFDAHLHVELISAGSLATRLRVSSFRYSESFDCTHSLKKVLEERLETVIVVSTVASECQSEFRALIDTMTRFCIMLGCKVFRLVLEKYSGRQNINMPAPDNILVLNWFDSNLAHVLERALRSKRTADILEFLADIDCTKNTSVAGLHVQRRSGPCCVILTVRRHLDELCDENTVHVPYAKEWRHLGECLL